MGFGRKGVDVGNGGSLEIGTRKPVARKEEHAAKHRDCNVCMFVPLGISSSRRPTFTTSQRLTGRRCRHRPYCPGTSSGTHVHRFEHRVLDLSFVQRALPCPSPCKILPRVLPLASTRKMSTTPTESDPHARIALLEKEKGDALELIASLRKKIYALEEENDLLALDNERLKGKFKEGGEGGRKKCERARQEGKKEKRGGRNCERWKKLRRSYREDLLS